MSYRLQILHESSYGQSQQITQKKFCNYVITNLRNYVIIIELKVWTPLSLLFEYFDAGVSKCGVQYTESFYQVTDLLLNLQR